VSAVWIPSWYAECFGRTACSKRYRVVPVRSDSIYVETQIRARLEELWEKTQRPRLHQRWDLRFTNIVYLPRPDEREPQRFRYSTRLGFGLGIDGFGETVGERDGAEGQRTSALRFWSDDRKSLIRERSGYWKYIPTDDGVRFITSYDYRVRGGFLGRAFDYKLFRPLMGWATAWSFDRLRMWIERGSDPDISIGWALTHSLARGGVGLTWMYRGALVKLPTKDRNEWRTLRPRAVREEAVRPRLNVINWTETVFGLLFFLPVPMRWPILLSIALMLCETGSIAFISRECTTSAFNPATINLGMVVLSLIALLSADEAPSARRCLRRPPRTRL
jgi:hypothetical protein